MNYLQFAAVLFLGVLFGIVIVAIVHKGADQSDRDRIDLIEDQGLTLTASPDKSTWGVVSQGLLLGTGKCLREAVDNALAKR